MFWVTTVIRVIAAMLDVVIVERWNIDVGIPDEVWGCAVCAYARLRQTSDALLMFFIFRLLTCSATT